MSSRLILDELDLDLTALTASLVVLIVFLIRHTLALGATVLQSSGAITTGRRDHQVILDGRGVLIWNGGNIGHDDCSKRKRREEEVAKQEQARETARKKKIKKKKRKGDV